jgi:hypothetical protein
MARRAISIFAYGILSLPANLVRSNVISHFAYAYSRHPALNADRASAYHWTINDWQVNECQQT